MPPLCMYGPVSSMLRSGGVLPAPSTASGPAGLARRASDSGLPNGSVPPIPTSSAVGRTPVLNQPVSARALPPLARPIDWVRLPATDETEALVSSGPEWHLAHWPL